jgi:hypothetical protein
MKKPTCFVGFFYELISFLLAFLFAGFLLCPENKGEEWDGINHLFNAFSRGTNTLSNLWS